MRLTPKAAAVTVLALAILVVADTPLAAQADHPSFAWFADLVSVDHTAKAVTARAPVESHVAGYIHQFEPGDGVVLFWSQHEYEGDVVRRIARADTTAAETGFILPVTYLSSDTAAHTLTFMIPLSDDIFSTLESAGPGTPVRFTSPMALSGAPITLSAALNAVPRPRPELVVEPVVWEGVDIAGSWGLRVDLMGSAMSLSCTLTQSGPSLGGECTGPPPLANVELAGSVDDRYVLFTFEAQVGAPWPALFVHTGELSRDGTTITDELEMMGDRTPFSMERQ